MEISLVTKITNVLDHHNILHKQNSILY